MGISANHKQRKQFERNYDDERHEEIVQGRKLAAMEGKKRKSKELLCSFLLSLGGAKMLSLQLDYFEKFEYTCVFTSQAVKLCPLEFHDSLSLLFLFPLSITECKPRQHASKHSSYIQQIEWVTQLVHLWANCSSQHYTFISEWF